MTINDVPWIVNSNDSDGVAVQRQSDGFRPPVGRPDPESLVECSSAAHTTAIVADALCSPELIVERWSSASLADVFEFLHRPMCAGRRITITIH